MLKMAKAETEPIKIMEVAPDEKLYFTEPFSEVTKTHIELKNLTFKDLMYKVSMSFCLNLPQPKAKVFYLF